MSCEEILWNTKRSLCRDMGDIIWPAQSAIIIIPSIFVCHIRRIQRFFLRDKPRLSSSQIVILMILFRAIKIKLWCRFYRCQYLDRVHLSFPFFYYWCCQGFLTFVQVPNDRSISTAFCFWRMHLLPSLQQLLARYFLGVEFHPQCFCVIEQLLVRRIWLLPAHVSCNGRNYSIKSLILKLASPESSTRHQNYLILCILLRHWL